MHENIAHTARSSQDHVWVLRGGGDGGDPSLVAFQRTKETQRFRHSVLAELDDAEPRNQKARSLSHQPPLHVTV